MAIRPQLIAASLMLIFTACSGVDNGGSFSSRDSSSEQSSRSTLGLKFLGDSPSRFATAAPPLAPTSATHLPNFSMSAEQGNLVVTSPRYIAAPSGKLQRVSGDGPDVVVSSQGGQGQIILSPNSQEYTIDYANETAYSSYAPEANDVLYAPTMKSPGDGCTEISTIYGYGSPEVGVWDFCIANNDQFHGTIPMNSTFLASMFAISTG